MQLEKQSNDDDQLSVRGNRDGLKMASIRGVCFTSRVELALRLSSLEEGIALVVSGRLALSSRGLVLGEERSTFGVGRAAERDVSACPGRNGNDQGQDEQHRHDGEGEDPLEGDNLGEELADTESGSQDAQVESHGVILFSGSVNSYGPVYRED